MAKKSATAKSTTANATTKKASPKKALAKKADAAKSKAAPKKGKAKATEATPDRGPSKTQVACLEVLAKSKTPMTRAQLSEALEGAFIGGKVMGHADPAKLKESSLVGRGLVRFTPAPKGDEEARAGVVYYEITAAGRKAVK